MLRGCIGKLREFVADLHIHGPRTYLPLPSRAKTFTFGSLYYSYPLRKPSNPKLCSFQTNKFTPPLLPSLSETLIIVQMEVKHSRSAPFPLLSFLSPSFFFSFYHRSISLAPTSFLYNIQEIALNVRRFYNYRSVCRIRERKE